MNWKKTFKDNITSGTNPLEITTAIVSTITAFMFFGTDSGITPFAVFLPIAGVIFLFNAEARDPTLIQRLSASFFLTLITFWKATIILIPIGIIIGITRKF